MINERPADGPRCSAQTNSGFLVAVEGGDGVGKTTIARLIGASTESEIEFLSKQHVPPEPSFARDRMCALSNTLWPGGTIPNGAELPGQYWEGLQTAWYSMAAEFVFGPRLCSGTSVIADGLYLQILREAHGGGTVTGRSPHPLPSNDRAQPRDPAQGRPERDR